MKNYLRFLTPMMLLLAVLFGGGKSLAESKKVSLTLSSSAKFGTSSGSTLKQNNVTWTATSTSGNIQNSYQTTYKGQQFGKNSEVWAGTFSTSDVPGTISNVEVAANTGGSASLSVKVGDTDFSSNGKQTVSVVKKSGGINTYSFEGSAEGKIVVSLSGTSKACYLGSITVTYEESGTSKKSTSITFPQSSYTFEVGEDVPVFSNAATLSPAEAGSVEYESSDEDMAVVGDNGDVTVATEKAGQVKITAKFAGNDEYAASSAYYTITIENAASSIADLKSQITAITADDAQSFMLTLKDAVVSYVNEKNAFVQDATGGILVYIDNNPLQVGQKFNGKVNVKAIKYKNWAEITVWTPTATMTTETVDELPLTVVTLADLTGDNYSKYESCRVKVVGVTVKSAFNSGNTTISQDDTDMALRNNNQKVTVTAGDVVSIIGFPGIYSATKQLNIYEQSAITVHETLTTAASGYATYAADYATNYSEAGLTAYTVKVNGEKVVATEYTGVVPAGEAVLVKGEASKEYTLAPATEDAGEFATELKASDGNVTSDGKTYFAFSSKGGRKGFKVVVKDITIPAKKGYLVVADAAAGANFLSFDDETTGINAVEAAAAADGKAYNMAGQRVSKAYKGIVIVGGKKYLNK